MKQALQLHLERTTVDAPSLRFQSPSGDWWVHGRRNPQRDAERAAVNLMPDANELLVLVGDGLGYQTAALLAAGCKALLVLEPDNQSLMHLLNHHTHHAGAPRHSGSSAELAALVTRRQIEAGWPDLRVIINPAYAGAFPEWVNELKSSLGEGRVPSAMGRLKRHKGLGLHSALVLDSGYYLVDDCARALESLGLDVTRLRIAEKVEASPTKINSAIRADEDYVSRLLAAIEESRPAFAFTVNHLGLDQAGRIERLLDSLGIPLIVWYVDSPRFVLKGRECPSRAHQLIFCWERTWIPWLKSHGYERVIHLPLGASARFEKRHHALRELSFVAGSNSRALKKWRGLLELNPWQEAVLKQLAAKVERGAGGRRVDSCLAELDYELKCRGITLDPDLLAGWMALQLTQWDRLNLARIVAGVGCDLFGDAEWSGLDHGCNFHGPLDYVEELPDHYATTRVTLNVTSRQMETAVNQRVFEAPLAGCLVLGDHQADMDEHFAEIAGRICWERPGQALKLTAYWLEAEAERRALVEELAARIRQRHMIEHRMRRVLEELEKPSRVAGAA